MLGLKLPTDPRWVNIVEKNIEEILTDHAYCEQKAASTAISLIVSFPEKSELVEAMAALVKEEMSHFKMAHDNIMARGWTLGRERKDEYVAALIEARSCERFRLLSENIKDKELAGFYRKLMVSEANHYTMFLNFARKYGNREEVDKKWQQLLKYEAELMKNLGRKETMHG